MRDTEAVIPSPLGPNIFTHSQEFLNIEQYKTIGREAIMNVDLGFAMIAVVVLLLIPNPVAAVLTFTCVVSAILELVGFMNFIGASIDSISVIFIVISLGLAVDYSVHVAHAYMSVREEDPVLRLQKTLGVCYNLSEVVLFCWVLPREFVLLLFSVVSFRTACDCVCEREELSSEL